MKIASFCFVILCLAFSQGFCEKTEDDFRVYDETTETSVRQFYRENHQNQTLEFVLRKKAEYFPLHRQTMNIWEALTLLDTLIDESDPDLHLPQSYHCYQTAEAIKRDGHPRWMIAMGFIHDLGKILTAFGEPQWAVVGDTFPVGCAFAKENVFPEFFEQNRDRSDPVYSTKLGIYEEGCGFDALHFSFSHDEYLYQVVKNYLPEEACYIIRYHSFYSRGGYRHFMSEKDHQMAPWLDLFSKYDLYSKDETPLDIDALRPFYKELMDEFFPERLLW